MLRETLRKEVVSLFVAFSIIKMTLSGFESVIVGYALSKGA